MIKPIMGISNSHTTSLPDALFSATQQRVLGLLFGQPDRSFFTNELISLAGMGTGAVQRELKRLATSGLVTVSRVGNQKHYQANANGPLYQELCSIARKTFGITDVVRAALEPLHDAICFSILFGSVAKGTDHAGSDIDLLVISDTLTLEALYDALESAERNLGRPISPSLYTSTEFRRRMESGNTFLKAVLDGKTLPIKGHMDDVVKSGQPGQDGPAQG